MRNVGEEFVWFFGVVEDRDDPLKLGRVRVRCYGWHTDDKVAVPTNSLPWAQPIQPITSAAMGDIGQSPTGIVEGTWVVGFFLDGKDSQKPVIMGTLAGIPTSVANTNKGFSDPKGLYPKRVEEPDVNRLARNDTDKEHSVLAIKEADRTKGVSTSTGGSWDEPASAYNAAYPYNHVTETESGHIIELDDTLDNERVHLYSAPGTFFEIDKNGNRVTRVVGDDYEIVAGSNYVNVQGSANLTVDGNLNLYVKKNWNVKVGGDASVQVTGNLDIDAARIDLN